MIKIHSRLRASAPSISFAIFLGVLLLIGTPFVAAPNVAMAHDEDSGPPMEFTPTELSRARLLFRHYCMDCHGPKLTGDEHDDTLFCPDVQGKDLGDYQEAVLDGPDDMPEFTTDPLPDTSDGYLILSTEDFMLLTLHETTFGPDQP